MGGCMHNLKNNQRLGNWPFCLDSFPIFKSGFYWVRHTQHLDKGRIISNDVLKSKLRGETMLKNVNYNLLETITIVSKSLYRYDTYIHDAENSKSSRELWTTFKAQREKELSMLLAELKNQIDSGMLALE
jgi:hypothetical protein